MSKKYNTLIFDWNGTLINDTLICIEAMNKLLEVRQMKLLDLETYQDKFTFPVKTYYEDIGFDFTKEPFEKPALEFIETYHTMLPSAKLFMEAKQVLSDFKTFGYDMIILSAMEQESLIKSVSKLGISEYFSAIIGIDNHFAKSKVERGKEVTKKLNIDTNKAVFIGDTLHDKEVADELGCKCILVANGHQSYNRLNIDGNIVSHSLKKLNELINII